MEQIFVQIASYRDPQCGPTIRDLLAKAEYPERISFGICLQWNFEQPEESTNCGPASLPDWSQIKIDAVDAQASLGTCWARAKCQQLWNGEAFTLQIDSHMRAELYWDTALLACWNKTGNANAIISCYPNGFTINDSGETCHYSRSILPIMGAKEFDANGILRLHGISTFDIPDQLPSSPPPGAFISAGMLFGPSRLIEAAPYDPGLYFYGEETTYAARLWTSGFDIYNPDRLLLYHLYKTTGHNMATHWADHADWNALDRASIAKVTELLSGKIDLGCYGLGRERSLADYQEWAGIDFNNKTIKAHAKAGIFGSSQIILKPETKAFARISSTKEEKADIAILTESQCRHGIFTYPSHDTYIGACLSNYGEWGEGEVQLLSHYLSEGSTAIEIGSNLGTHTIPMARMVGPSGRILAYEPQRLIFQLLCHNLIANRIFNVQAFNAAAGARSGSAIVPDLDLHKPNNFGGTRIHAKSGLKTEIKTLDDISLQSLSLIKIDAEDCESEILLGAINTIDQHRPAILLEYNPGQQAKINRILRLFNQYRFFAFTEPLYNPDNYNSNPNNLFPRVASHGLIACKDAPPSDLCNRIRFREVLISRS